MKEISWLVLLHLSGQLSAFYLIQEITNLVLLQQTDPEFCTEVVSELMQMSSEKNKQTQLFIPPTLFVFRKAD